MARKRGTQDERRDRRPGGFAEPHAEIDQRREAELVEQRPVRGFGRDMGRHRMGQRVAAQPGERRQSRGADEAVDDDRNALPPRRQRRAQDGGELTAAHCGGDLQRIAEDRAMTRQSSINRGALAGESLIVDAGAAARPARPAAAEQRSRDGRRRRGVADAHLAETDEVGIGRHGVVSGRDRGEKRALVHGRGLGEVRRRPVEVERNDAQLRPGHTGELVDGGAAGGEIRHHLHRHGGRKRRNPLRHHAMIAGEHQHLDAIELRRMPRLPAREPGDELLEAAEAGGRLGELGIARSRGRSRSIIAGRQVETRGAQGREGWEARHGVCLPNLKQRRVGKGAKRRAHAVIPSRTVDPRGHGAKRAPLPTLRPIGDPR